ncbi:hypothetical protein CPB84DRAFT_1811542 [Gymnopilus junonius]|uniref:Uncharacterized protein n=1 Tax=Gymnopilus junonius TaxID=109634 RepID=A0A9P5P1S8_GYMJU|nr:hypothetical protein CPB84DRAFT_1811542 [Gymnopilus junonius]
MHSAAAGDDAAAKTRRHSHHRRRSSVSTRHESAEMMGVALPDLPPSTSDDNINLGEKDSIRRRALWALEGKPDVAFSKVEIPDISTPDVEKLMFDFATKSSSSFGSGLNSLSGNKRDSFKLLGPSSSSKDQLGTLLEEEEEEEDSSPLGSSKENVPPPNTPITPVLSVTKATPAKPRPSTLNLRPLSLTPENLATIVPSLPSPSPSPSTHSGLRSLALTPSPAPSNDDWPEEVAAKQSWRRALASPTPASRKPILNLALEKLESKSTADDDTKPSRRSSISYKRSSSGMTPTFARRYSSSADSQGSTSADDEFFPGYPTQARPLSANLERALSMRRRESGGYSNGGNSRPMSLVDLAAAGEPSDEMLRLIADLKAERDELKRDVDGWRTRVSDMESQIGVLAKRVENERRDAWVARSRVGLLEVEKGVLSKKVEALDDLIAVHGKEKAAWDSEKAVLIKENEEVKNRVVKLELDLETVRKELETERTRMAKQELDPLATPTPRSFDSFNRPGLGSKKHGLGFMSVDSESSTTDVEPDSSSDDIAFTFGLKSVQEDDEVDYSEEEENGLAGYEDEDEEDMSLQSSSSFGSDEDLPRSIAHLHQPSSPTTPRPQVFTPRSSHTRRATLSKTWTFPFGGQLQTPPKEEDEEDIVDRFFGCLEDIDSDASGSVPNSPSAYSYEKSKNMFASGFKFTPADDNASFFFPGGVGMPADDEGEKRLEVVAEEEETEEVKEEIAEDDGDMFGDMGGIRITFTPPQEEVVIQISSPVKRTSPPPIELDDDDEEEDEATSGVIPFNFGRPLAEERQPSPLPAPVPAATAPPPSSPSMIPRPASPSSLPRAATCKPLVSSTSLVSFTLTSPKSPPVAVHRGSPAVSSSNFVTPPNKRGGASPSFLPQPVSSPSPMRVVTSSASTKPKVIPTSTFIRQPSTRKPLFTAKGQSSTASFTNNHLPFFFLSVPARNVHTHSFHTSSDEAATLFGGEASNHVHSPAQMKSIDFLHDRIFTIQRPSQPVTPRTSPIDPSSPPASAMSSSTLTNFIPFSWSSRGRSVASDPSSSPKDVFDDQSVGPQAFVSRKNGERGFVSREKQLGKLQARIEAEGGVVAMRTSVNVQCRKCSGQFVCI